MFSSWQFWQEYCSCQLIKNFIVHVGICLLLLSSSTPSYVCYALCTLNMSSVLNVFQLLLLQDLFEFFNEFMALVSIQHCTPICHTISVTSFGLHRAIIKYISSKLILCVRVLLSEEEIKD
jgi:hypothetical protein